MQQENPEGAGWATGDNYVYDIVGMIEDMMEWYDFDFFICYSCANMLFYKHTFEGKCFFILTPMSGDISQTDHLTEQ